MTTPTDIHEWLRQKVAELPIESDETKNVTEFLLDIFADAGLTLEIHKNQLWVW